MSIAEINRMSFSLPYVGTYYTRQHGLEPDERAVFDRVLRKHGPITDLLDLGVGAGRTTEAIRDITTNYVGIDFSPAMIGISRRRFPGTDLRVGDARDLSPFPAGSFDVVYFSYNGIDYVDHDGRLAILTEAYRVLREGGMFVFSTHNRSAKPATFWRALNKSLSRQILQLGWFALHLPWLAVGKLRHLRFRHLETSTAEYEIRNDTAHAYRMMTYYISVNHQIEQLRRVGFGGIEVFDIDGHRQVSPGTDTQSAWMHYLCCK